jgi:hypothetical protein
MWRALLTDGLPPYQRQSLAACRINAERSVTPSSVAEMELSDAITLCMEASGYERNEANCPLNLQTADVPRGKTYEETGKHMLENLQRREPSCYEPLTWYGKTILKL